MTSVRDGHRSFRALLSALSYPGRWYRSPSASGAKATKLLLQSVWEAGVCLHRTGSSIELPWEATPSAPAGADVILIEGESAGGVLVDAQRGSDIDPGRGATVVWVSGAAPHQTAVRLEGPGVKGSYETTLPIGREDLAMRAQACADYPRGIDIIFVAPDGSLAALPRTTRVVTL